MIFRCAINRIFPASPPNSKHGARLDLCTFRPRMAARLWMRTLVFSSFRRYRFEIYAGKLKSSFFTLTNSPSSFKRAQFSAHTMTSETINTHVLARAESGAIQVVEGKNTGERLSEGEILVNAQTSKKPMEVAVGRDTSLPDASLPGQDMGSAEPPRDLTGQGEIDSGGDNKYLYMQRGFTSEIFKIEIRNIPKYFSYSVRVISFICIFSTCDLINQLSSVGKSICLERIKLLVSILPNTAHFSVS